MMQQTRSWLERWDLHRQKISVARYQRRRVKSPELGIVEMSKRLGNVSWISSTDAVVSFKTGW